MAAQLLLIAVFVGSMIIMSLNYKKRKKKIVFIGGASIYNSSSPGNYISHLNYLLKKEDLEDKFAITTAEIASVQLTEVFEKIEVTVLDKGPDIVIINFSKEDMIQWEITDVTQLDAFYKSIIKRLVDARIDIIIGVPTIRNEQDQVEDSLQVLEYIQRLVDIAFRNNISTINMLSDNYQSSESDISNGIISKELLKLIKAF